MLQTFYLRRLLGQLRAAHPLHIKSVHEARESIAAEKPTPSERDALVRALEFEVAGRVKCMWGLGFREQGFRLPIGIRMVRIKR